MFTNIARFGNLFVCLFIYLCIYLSVLSVKSGRRKNAFDARTILK